MKEFQGITDRIAVMKFKLKRNSRLTLIQVYAPTANSTEKDCEQFYQELTKTYKIQKSGWKDWVIIMGDFNSQIGSRKKEEETIIGPYNYGKRNDRGEKLVQFCLENNLKIINTWFKKRKGKQWTWISPNNEYKNQIDYTLVPKEIKKYITDFNVIKNFEYHSDHRPIGIKCNPPPPGGKWTTAKRKNKVTINENNRYTYQQELTNILKQNNQDMEVDRWNEIVKAIEKAAKASQEEDQKTNEKKIPDSIRKMIKKREDLKNMKYKTSKEKIELNITCKIIKRELRIFNSKNINTKINKIFQTTKSTKAIKKLSSPGKIWCSYLLNNKKEKVYGRKDINKVATDYYRTRIPRRKGLSTS